MLLTTDIEQKTIGHKPLFADLKISITEKEKLAIIGRNGVGKTTLFRMLSGEDTDYSGNISFGRGIRVVTTAQEHHGLGQQTTLEYIVNNLPEYTALLKIIESSPATMNEDMRQIERYSSAVERFNHLDYYNIADKVRQSLADYQLEDTADMPMANLSGGQKRFVELIKVEYSDADLALIDEPTNHMDYVAKAAFIKWFSQVKHAVVVITHDRDLLNEVDRIIEIKNLAAFNFPGNYTNYLQQNALITTNQLNEFEVTQRRIDNVKKQLQSARAKKPKWGGTADKKNPFVVIENRLLKELAELEKLEKPSFWIDQESVDAMRPAAEEAYQKHKAKNIKIHRHAGQERRRELLEIDNVQVGYGQSLFAPINARVLTGDRLRLVGRNGAGKTSLVKTIIASLDEKPATLLHGSIKLDTKLRINTYEQEIDEELFEMTLATAIERLYHQFNISISDQQVMRIMSDYLFDPHGDGRQMIASLSGGQKARLQLIKMFANEPNLLILDEPTNHLDLPSIEELEAALAQYNGALIYISHDSYLAKNLGGTELSLSAA